MFDAVHEFLNTDPSERQFGCEFNPRLSQQAQQLWSPNCLTTALHHCEREEAQLRKRLVLINRPDRRVTGAFLLKGPANFSPMSLNHLGKNNEQIYRLAMESADVLFVQHSHDVTPAGATLRAFAVQPSRPRRYCIIDGRDSIRLLQAYGLYDDALHWSRRG